MNSTYDKHRDPHQHIIIKILKDREHPNIKKKKNHIQENTSKKRWFLIRNNKVEYSGKGILTAERKNSKQRIQNPESHLSNYQIKHC